MEIVQVEGYTIVVRGKNCNGCVRHKKDVIVSFAVPCTEENKKSVEFIDIFLTTEQAEGLLTKLMKVIDQNEQ
jgi:hypothetical protein